MIMSNTRVILFCIHTYVSIRDHVDDGRLYSWGYGCNGRLGHGSEEDGKIPREVREKGNAVGKERKRRQRLLSFLHSSSNLVAYSTSQVTSMQGKQVRRSWAVTGTSEK